MAYNIIPKLTFLALGLLPLSMQAKASDIFIGGRGPTNFQIDTRLSYTEKTDNKGNKTASFGDNEILKYWDGKEIGVFGFINGSAKSIDNGKEKSTGLGDLVLGIGPRGTADLGKYGTLDWISYLGASLPTGDEKLKPALGNGRYDLKAGLFSTWLSKQKNWGVDFSSEYTRAGKVDGIKGKDEINFGLLGERKLNDQFRLALGLVGKLKESPKENIQDWDLTVAPRAVLRYTPKNTKRWHLELIGDYDPGKVINKDLPPAPKGFGATLQFRVNF